MEERKFTSKPIRRKPKLDKLLWLLVFILIAINIHFSYDQMFHSYSDLNARSFEGQMAPRALPWVFVYTKSDIGAYIVKQAILEGIDPVRVLRIAQCESSLNPKAKHKVSSASGLFAFTTATFKEGVKKRNLDWKAEDVFDVEKNTEMALWYMKRGEWRRWVCK